MQNRGAEFSRNVRFPHVDDIRKSIEDEIERRGDVDLLSFCRQTFFPKHAESVYTGIANKMISSGKYIDLGAFKLAKNPNYKKEKFQDRNPFLDKLIWAVLSSIFSILVGVLLWQVTNRSQNHTDNRQDSLQNSLRDSLTTFQKQLKDLKEHQ